MGVLIKEFFFGGGGGIKGGFYKGENVVESNLIENS